MLYFVGTLTYIDLRINVMPSIRTEPAGATSSASSNKFAVRMGLMSDLWSNDVRSYPINVSNLIETGHVELTLSPQFNASILRYKVSTSNKDNNLPRMPPQRSVQWSRPPRSEEENKERFHYPTI